MPFDRLTYDGFRSISRGRVDEVDSQIQGLSRVFVLDLTGARIQGQGLRHLAGFTGLRELYLRYATITDEGLASLPDLPALKVLDLHGTQVTDAGLARIQGNSQLGLLYLGETAVTTRGPDALRAERPGLRVYRQGGSPRTQTSQGIRSR